jgi:hypothetical protein
MDRIDKYANWLVSNQDKKGTPEFETVANAYKDLRGDDAYSKRGKGLAKIDFQQQAKAQAEDEQMFDRTTGIKNAKLRASLSAVENDAEKEAVLQRFGLTSNDYTQDNRGQFALTPSGASKFGVDTDKNIIIDESGFSRYDIADLAGIVPEVGGAVAGGLKGAAVGTALGPVGTLIGGAIGAAGGAFTGSLGEEAIEGLSGVSKQSAKEILKDAGKEALYAGAGELAFGIPFLAFKALAPSAGIVKEGGEKLQLAGKAQEMGFQLSKQQMDLGPIPARIESIMEKVIGQSPRTAANFKALQTKLDEYNNFIKQAQSNDDRLAGDLFLDMSKNAGTKFIKAQRDALDEINKNLKEAADILSGGLGKNEKVSEQLFAQLNQTFKVFEDVSATNFQNINNLLESGAGSANILPTTAIDEIAENMIRRFGLTVRQTDEGISVIPRGAGDEQQLAAAKIVQSLKTVGTEASDGTRAASFANIYAQRKAFKNSQLGIGEIPVAGSNKTLQEIVAPSVNLKRYMKQIEDAFDDSLEISQESIDPFLKKLIGQKKITAEDAEKIRLGSQQIGEARRAYAEGAQFFNDIGTSIGTKNLLGKLNAGQFTKADLEDSVMKVIKNDKPKNLQKLGQAMGGGTKFNNLKKRLSGAWLRQNLKDTGFDSINPKKFNPLKFKESVYALGKTGDELFGKAQYSQIKKFADDFEDLNLTNITDDMINDFAAKTENVLPEEIDLVGNLRLLKEAGQNANAINKRGLFKKINDGDYIDSPDEVVDLVNSNTTKINELKRIMKYYEGDDKAVKTIQASFIEKALDGIGVTKNAKDLDQLANRILKSDGKSGGKLAVIFGKKEAEEIKDFAKVIKLIASDQPAGDLVAGNIATNFMSNIGRIARITIIGQLFTGKAARQQITDAYRATNNIPNERRSKILGSVINGILRQSSVQQLQSGVDETTNQARAIIKNTPQLQNVGNQLSNIQQNISQPNPASGLGQINVGQPALRSSSIIVPDPRTQALVSAGKI